MHRLLCLITLAFTAPALAFADTEVLKDDLPTTAIEQATPSLSKDDVSDAKQDAAQQVPEVSLDLLCDTLAASAHQSGLPTSFFANLIWQIADLRRGPYRLPQYERVMLPMTVLRRFDCARLHQGQGAGRA